MKVYMKAEEMSVTTATVPIDTMVPISKFSRGGASSAFAQVKAGKPVTVLRNNEPTFVILRTDDYTRYREMEAELEELRDREARRQVRDREYTHTIHTRDDMRKYIDSI